MNSGTDIAYATLIEWGIQPSEIWQMTLPEYLLIYISKMEIMEQMEKDREDVTEFDSLDELDAALSKLDKELEKGQPAKPLS